MLDGHADVLIIGAGASGGVAARRLATAGLRVVCLEQGEWPDRASYRGAEPDWELSAGGRSSGAPSERRSIADYPIDESSSDIGILNYNGVGGGTVLYAAQWPRMLPADFAVRSGEGLADDWPLTYAELQPFYERVDREMGVSGLGGNPIYPPGEDPPLPPLPIGAGGLRIARAHDRLGWHWWPDANAIVSAPYGVGRNPCVQRGACAQGCGEGAKASTDVTHWPQAIAGGATLVTGARVHRLVLDGRGLVAGAEWTTTAGEWRFQSADIVLLAANGIGTPRLLLNSACTQFPDGLANRSGLVGRRLMLHPLASVFGLFGEFLHSWQGQAGASIQSMQFYRSDPNRGFIRGARWSLTPTGGPMRNALAGGVWGPEHHTRLLERLGHGASWALIAEDLPGLDNRVELSTTTTDSSGIPGATVTYRMSDNTRRMLEWHGARAAESLREAGAAHTEFNWLPRNGHLLGTARMGDDPATSVVDRWGMAHDIANLGIIDGSVFVTAGGVNPTSTICALALRAAEHLLDRRADVPSPDRVRIFAPTPRPPDAQSRAEAEPDLEFDERERRRFEAWADFLIPGTSQMPSPSEVGVPGPLLDQVLQARPYLAPALRGALQREPQTDDPTLGLNDLRPEQRIALTTAIAGAYYLAPQVRVRIGYPGQEAIPVPSFRLPEYFDEGLIDRVLERTELTAPGSSTQ